MPVVTSCNQQPFVASGWHQPSAVARNGNLQPLGPAAAGCIQRQLMAASSRQLQHKCDGSYGEAGGYCNFLPETDHLQLQLAGDDFEVFPAGGPGAFGLVA